MGVSTSLRRRATARSCGTESHKLSAADLAALDAAKAKLNYREIETLYQKWRSGEKHFQQVRDEYRQIGKPRDVRFLFTPVNGQVVLFERHPGSLR